VNAQAKSGLFRVDVEGASELAQRPGRPSRLVEPPILQRQHERQDKHAPDRTGSHEHGELVAGEQLDHEGAGDRRDGHTDAERAGDQAALHRRHLVWQDRDQSGEQRVEQQLSDAPAHQDDRNAGGRGDSQDAQRTADQSDDHPRPPHAEPGGGAVAQLAEERIADHG